MIENLKESLKKINIQADWIGLRKVSENTKKVLIRNEKLDTHQSVKNCGIMVEVMVDGHFACSASQDLSQKGIEISAKKAVELAKKSLPHKLYNFTEKQRPQAVGRYPLSQKIDSQSYTEIYSRLIEATKKMKSSSHHIIAAFASTAITESTTEFVSTNGSELKQEKCLIGLDQMVSAEKNGILQHRSNGKKVVQGSFDIFNKNDIYKDSERLANEVLELLDAENCPTNTRDILIMPDQLYLQIHESIGHPLELDRILGDERNYAGWSFVKPDDIGKLKYGSSLLNISFDPHVEGEIASYHFDDTGAFAQKKHLIKDGILVAGIGGLESQARINKPGVAASRATSWNRAPIDRMANINMEAGESTMQQMIENTEKGLLVCTNKSWSIDDFRNKFQFGCEYAKIIKDGQITKTVRNPNYKGSSLNFWRSLKMVGASNTSEAWGSFYCGKGEPNQTIAVGHKTPPALFSDVEVFGGA